MLYQSAFEIHNRSRAPCGLCGVQGHYRALAETGLCSRAICKDDVFRHYRSGNFRISAGAGLKQKICLLPGCSARSMTADSHAVPAYPEADALPVLPVAGKTRQNPKSKEPCDRFGRAAQARKTVMLSEFPPKNKKGWEEDTESYSGRWRGVRG